MSNVLVSFKNADFIVVDGKVVLSPHITQVPYHSAVSNFLAEDFVQCLTACCCRVGWDMQAEGM